MHRDPGALEPLIDRAIDHSFGLFRSEAGRLVIPRDPKLRYDFLIRQSKLFLRAVFQQTPKFDSAKSRIRTIGAFVVAGAGLSYSSEVPLTIELADALRFVSISVPHSPTSLDDLRAAFEQLKGSPDSMTRFREQFRSVCRRKPFSRGHFLLATELGDHIVEIVCLNWDDLIESAAPEKFHGDRVQSEEAGAIRGERFLWKFHGDVRSPCDKHGIGQGGWVFPFDGGHVFESFKRYAGTNSRMKELFAILVVGYGEGDPVISHEVIERLSQDPHRPVIRVGLAVDKLHDPDYLVGPADYVLDRILDFGRERTDPLESAR